MNPITRLDRWLIDKPYQSIVDLSQRQPAWWAEQCAWAAGVVGIIQYALSDSPLWLLVVLLIGAAGLALSERFLSSVGQGGSTISFRLLFLFCTATDVLMLAVHPSPMQLATDALLASFGYFASCQPPRPRLPGRKMALSENSL